MHGALAAALRAPWLRDPLWARARMVPALDLRFAETQSLRDWVSGRDLVTFTRASNGTRVTSAGTIETLGNDVPRFTFDAAGRCQGLLVEEARTNLLLNSATLSTQSVSVTATAHTLHFTGTGTVTLSGASTAGPLVGTGTGEANRVSLTFTPSAGTLTLTVSGTVSNAQLEPGSFRTSLIPATGTAATRAADIATISGGSFSSWYRIDEGTLFLSGKRIAYSGASVPVSINDGTVSNRLVVRQDSATTGVAIFVTSTTTRAAPAVAYTSAAAEDRTCFAYDANVMAAASTTFNSVTTSLAGAPVVDRLSIGNQLNSGSPIQFFNGPISRLVYWPRRLPDHILQELTR